MKDHARPSALRRKAGVGRPPPEIGKPTAAKALRIALAQAAHDVADLVAVPSQIDDALTTRDPACTSLPDHALLALIEGQNSRFGLVALDPQFVAALIEILTTGRVAARPAAARAPTRTDAVMCADLIDRVLELFEEEIAGETISGSGRLTGFRYATALADARAVAMSLEEVPYRQFQAELDLGPGAKTGRAVFLFPADPPGQTARGAAVSSAFTDALEAHVMSCATDLTVTLSRVHMSLAEVAALCPGTVIPIAHAAISSATIADMTGRDVARGKLGQINGHRAVRIVPPLDVPFAAPIGTSIATPAAGAASAAAPNKAVDGDATPSDNFDLGADSSELPFAAEELPELPGIPTPPPDLPELPD